MLDVIQNDPAVCELLERRLKDFPLYKSGHEIRSKRRGRKLFLSYSNNIFHRPNSLDISVQISNEVCYILSIEIPEDQRGRGYGTQLYTIFEAIAMEQNCRKMQTTPSGDVIDSKWWEHRGFIPIPNNKDEEYEKLL